MSFANKLRSSSSGVRLRVADLNQSPVSFGEVVVRAFANPVLLMEQMTWSRNGAEP